MYLRHSQGSCLLSTDQSGEVMFWNTFDQYSERRRQTEPQAITQLVFDQSDDIIFMVDTNGQLCVYACFSLCFLHWSSHHQRRQHIGSLRREPIKSPKNTLAATLNYHQQGSLLITGTTKGHIHVWTADKSIPAVNAE